MFDTLSLTVETGNTTWPDQVVFRINGTDLRVLLREAGLDETGMTGPPRFTIAEHPDHLLGGPDRWEDPDDPFDTEPALLGCGCGQPGCAAVLAHIEVTEDTVVWSDFRRDRSDRHLRIGPFRFARRRYEAAVKELRHA